MTVNLILVQMDIYGCLFDTAYIASSSYDVGGLNFQLSKNGNFL